MLVEQMIGQHLTDDEIKAQSDNLLREHCGFSTMLLEQMDSKGNGSMSRTVMTESITMLYNYVSNHDMVRLCRIVLHRPDLIFRKDTVYHFSGRA